MVVVTTEDLKPGTVLLPVETEVCPQPQQQEQLCPGQQPPGEVSGFLCTGRQAVAMAMGLVPSLVLPNPVGTSEACRSHCLKASLMPKCMRLECGDMGVSSRERSISLSLSSFYAYPSSPCAQKKKKNHIHLTLYGYRFHT